MWDRPDVDFIQSQDVANERVAPGTFGFAGGGLKRVLSRDDADGAETALYRIADRQQGTLTSEVDIYIVAGGALLNGDPLHSGDYVHAPAGSRVDLWPDVTGLKLYCGFWGPSTLTGDADAGADLLLVRPETLSWTPAEWSGDTKLEPGAMVKELRVDEKAFIYLAAMLPGWHCEMAEAHPVYEESFKIYGDTLMGSRGVMRQAAYFYRGPGVFHGPLYSRGGTMSFIRSDGRTSTEYRNPGAGGTWQELSRVAYDGVADRLARSAQDPA
jgi:hypothetical protein